MRQEKTPYFPVCAVWDSPRGARKRSEPEPGVSACQACGGCNTNLKSLDYSGSGGPPEDRQPPPRNESDLSTRSSEGRAMKREPHLISSVQSLLRLRLLCPENLVFGSKTDEGKKVKERTFFFFFAKIPTWQRSCISGLPSACQPSSSGHIAKKHKNKLLASAGVPMGTGPPRVRPLRRSSAQTARYPTPPPSGGGALSRGGLLISVSDLSCKVP